MREAGELRWYGLPIFMNMGSMGLVKTTIEISDALLARARRHARAAGKPLRAVIEEGLRRVLETSTKPEAYRLADRSVGKAGGRNPLDALSWQDLRDEIYGGRHD